MREAFIAHLHDLFETIGPISTRPMFGGHGIYLDELMVGVVFGETLYLKTDAQTRPQFEAAGGAPFVYRYRQRDGVMRAPLTLSYWSVPEAAMESAQAMRPWAQLAQAAALRKPVNKLVKVPIKPRRDR